MAETRVFVLMMPARIEKDDEGHIKLADARIFGVCSTYELAKEARKAWRGLIIVTCTLDKIE